MINKYRVHLETIDPDNEEQDIHYSTLVEATNENEAIEIAKDRQGEESPELPRSKTWAWHAYKTNEAID
ncbi:MAG: hypothetical protein L3J98_09895 [Gammaproteobacteria bacterium]|nr:hypothetical protein [Gammaproteobacteria bacterium]MCF6260447.1 hypothetical protein [Gammaproteobacteria bacterium]